MAEGLGFEPRKELPLCRFSRPVLSTAQPSFLMQGFIIKKMMDKIIFFLIRFILDILFFIKFNI